MEIARKQYTGNAARLLLCVLIIGSGSAGSAQAAAYVNDGCARLASIVEQSLEQVMHTDSRSRFGLLAAGTAPDAVAACATAAATTSSAFGRAMLAAGIVVSWNDSQWLDPGDYCLGHYLDQCYPRTSPGILNHSTFDAARVTLAWNTVVAGVRQGMLFGAASDMTFFRPAQLADGLRISLAVTLRHAPAGARYDTGVGAWPD